MQQMTWAQAARTSGSMVTVAGTQAVRRWTAVAASWAVAIALVLALLLVVQGVGWEAAPGSEIRQPAAAMPAPTPEPGPGPG